MKNTLLTSNKINTWLSRYKFVFTFIFLVILLNGCANQLPPGGGEVDKTPPEITEVYPQNGTVNFTDDYFELSFSEFIDKRSLKDAIFISPSPGGELELNWSWSGTSVKVSFPKPLKKNTTYVVTIGTDLVDIHAHNRMASSYSFSFSTGSVVDKGTISGRVYADKPSGVMLFAYKKEDTSHIDPSVLKPDYISQAGDSGYFKLRGLGPGTYRVFAIDDQYRDLLFQADQDKYGVPNKDVILTIKDTAFSNLNYYLTKTDTLKPRILTAVMTDEHHVLVSFSKDIDSSSLYAQNFYLYDSTLNNSSAFVYGFKGNTKQKDFVLSIKKEVKSDDNIYIIAKEIKDSYGNISRGDNLKLITNNKKDTTKTSIFKMEPQANEKTDFLLPVFKFYFDDAFDSVLAMQGITFTDTAGKSVKYKCRFIDDASIILSADEELIPKKDYRIKFDYNKFVNLTGNKLDSVYIYKFSTINGLDFTGATGIVKNVNLKRNPVLVLQGIDKFKKTYVTKPDAECKFNFERIEAGKYQLWGYYDENKDNAYNYGNIFPFEPSEKFVSKNELLELKPRWTVTDIIFDFIE